LFTPVAQWRAQIPSSKGKKRKAALSQSNDTTKRTLNKPIILDYMAIGLNSTLRLLQDRNQASPRAIFVTHPISEIQYAHLVPLIIERVSPVWLVELQDGSEAQLCGALGLPRVSILAVKDGAPDAEAIWERLRSLNHVRTLEVAQAMNGQWLGTKIEC